MYPNFVVYAYDVPRFVIRSYLLLKVRAMNIWKYFLDALFLSMADTYIVELQGTK